MKSATVGNNTRFVQEQLRRALAVMDKFPPNFVPKEVPPKEFIENAGFSKRDVLKNPKAAATLQKVVDEWPNGFYFSFLELSSIIGQILSTYEPWTATPDRSL